MAHNAQANMRRHQLDIENCRDIDFETLKIVNGYCRRMQEVLVEQIIPVNVVKICALFCWDKKYFCVCDTYFCCNQCDEDEKSDIPDEICADLAETGTDWSLYYEPEIEAHFGMIEEMVGKTMYVPDFDTMTVEQIRDYMRETWNEIEINQKEQDNMYRNQQQIIDHIATKCDQGVFFQLQDALMDSKK